MGLKEVSAAVIKTQKEGRFWDMVSGSEDCRFIQMSNRENNTTCTVSININNIATVELILRDEANEVIKHYSKEMAASRWHINTAITCFNKAAFCPTLLESKDIPFLVTADTNAISELTESLEFACNDKSVNFGFLREGTTPFEKGIWLIKLHSKISGEMKPIFELIFGKGSYDDFAHILFSETEEAAA